MAADFFFDPATFDIPTLNTLRYKWINIHDLNVREVIAREDQFLQFHLFSLKSIKHTNVGGIGKHDCYVLDLGLSVRGGAIKAALLAFERSAEGQTFFEKTRNEGFREPTAADNSQLDRALPETRRLLGPVLR